MPAVLENDFSLKKYINNTSWLLMDKFVKLTLGLLVGVWVARFLGPENFGTLSYAQTVVALLIAFSTLGLDGIVVKELVNNSSDKNKLLGTSFFLKLVGATFLVLILLLYYFLSDSRQSLYIALISITSLFHSFNVVDFYFQSIVKSKFVAISNVLTLVISSVIKVILIINNAELVFFVYALLFDAACLATLLVYFYCANNSRLFNWCFDFNWAKRLLKSSWPLILSSLVVTLYMKIDQIMIERLLGLKSVGIYAAAIRLSEVWYFIPTVISSSFFPAVLSAKNTSALLYETRMQDLYYFLAWVSLVFIIPIIYWGGTLITALYGEQFSESSNVLVIHVCAGFFVFMGVARGNWILAEGLQIYSLLYLSASLIVNVTLNVVFIEDYGLVGAAYATLVAQFCAVLLFPSFFKKTRVSSFMIMKALLLLPSIRRLKMRG